MISLPVIDLEVVNAGNPGQPCLNGKAGICGTPSSCKTSTVTGACNGGSDNVCCLTAAPTPPPPAPTRQPATPATPATPSGSSSLALFSPGGKQGQRERFLIAAAAGAGITGTQLAQFLAQMCHESDSYRAMEEYASGAAYEGRRDLGNTQPGDGVRYKGRGFIQITGRANYQKYGSKLGQPLEANPTLASNPEIAAKVAISYWKTIVVPKVSDFSATTTVTRLINGGTNGLDDRLKYFKLYVSLATQLLARLNPPRTWFRGQRAPGTRPGAVRVAPWCDNSALPETEGPRSRTGFSLFRRYSGASPRPLGDFGAKCLNGKNGICGDPKQCKGTVVSGTFVVALWC